MQVIKIGGLERLGKGLQYMYFRLGFKLSFWQKDLQIRSLAYSHSYHKHFMSYRLQLVIYRDKEKHIDICYRIPC